MFRLVVILLVVSLAACQSNDLAHGAKAVPIVDGRGRVVGVMPAQALQAGKPATASLSQQITSPVNAEGVGVVNELDYTPAEYLESVGFNPEGKKKFFVMDDGTQARTIEYVAGVDIAKLSAPKVVQASYTLAENYDVLAADSAAALTKIDCLTPLQRKEAKEVKSKQFSVWPLLPKVATKQQITVLNISRMQPHSYAKLYSYAQNNQAPQYYWPVVLFMDKEGCAISASTQYYQGDTAATMLKHSGIYGTLRIPSNTHYIALTPIKQLIDYPMLQLSKAGAIDWIILP